MRTNRCRPIACAVAAVLAAVIPLAARAGSLFVADAEFATVLRFRLVEGVPQTQLQSTLRLPHVPSHVAIGPAARLFVAYGSDPSIDVFAANAVGRARPLGHLQIPKPAAGIAVDDAGYLYVSGLEPGTVDVYAPGANGSVKPIKKIVEQGHPPTAALALGPQGRLYVANDEPRNYTIVEFADPLTSPTPVGILSLPGPFAALAVDVTGEAYVLVDAVKAYSPSACCVDYPSDRTVGTGVSSFSPLAFALARRYAYVIAKSVTGADHPVVVDTFDILRGTQRPLSEIAGPVLGRPVAVAVQP